MANSYYTVTGNPSAQTRGSSATVRSEFIAIQTGFDGVSTAIAARGLIAGQAWTGAHNFTGGTITVPTLPYGTSGNFAVSWDALNAAIFASANLPAQAAKAGQFLKTNGSVPSWAYPGIGAINAQITASTTLAGTYLYVPVQMASLGQSVTLPAANTLSVGGPQYIIDNTKGGYPCGIRDNAGTLLMAVAAGGEAFVSLKDNSTAAGAWSITGTNLEPGLITIDNTFSSTYLSSVLPQFVALDNNTSIHFANLSSGFAAFVVDNTGKVIGTPVTVSATASYIPYTAFKISSTQAVVFYGLSGGTTTFAVVLTLSGSSPSLTLAVGTSNNIATAWAQQENFTGAPQIVQLSGTSYLLSGAISNLVTSVACVISGTSVSFGAMTTILGSSAPTNSVTSYALTATTALVLYKSGSTTPYTNNAVVVSVSGTTCTVGTPVALITSSSTTAPCSMLLSPTKALISDDANSSKVTTMAVTISGTAATAGAAFDVELSVSVAVQSYTGNFANRYNPHLFPLSANTALLWYVYSSTSRAVVLTESSGTITAGQILYASAFDNSGLAAIFPQSTSEFLAVKTEGATNPYKFRAHPHKISGTSITTGATMPLDGQHPTSTPAQLGFVRLSSGDYCLVPGLNGNSMIPVIRSNGDALNYRGAVRVPSLSTITGSLPAVASNRLVILGDTHLQGQTTGTSTYQLRLLNIEVAA